ncbi:hypothetical protein AVEN_110353-1 [Araneus ventricosus]|uniref:Uncharacterized protein n=1 Tax=Araneus ventricosus TaxID=182803 RepID=A0A4Y2END3_ARAVE|nr:hypothetical protein AVEN_110353-1 [Araneus ventricosus]
MISRDRHYQETFSTWTPPTSPWHPQSMTHRAAIFSVKVTRPPRVRVRPRMTTRGGGRMEVTYVESENEREGRTEPPILTKGGRCFVSRRCITNRMPCLF